MKQTIRKNLHRALSLFMAMVMCLGVLQLPTFAKETEEEYDFVITMEASTQASPYSLMASLFGQDQAEPQAFTYEGLGQQLLAQRDHDPDLAAKGDWISDNEDILTMYPDGSALVREPGTVEVTFTYAPKLTTAEAAGGSYDEEQGGLVRTITNSNGESSGNLITQTVEEKRAKSPNKLEYDEEGSEPGSTQMLVQKEDENNNLMYDEDGNPVYEEYQGTEAPDLSKGFGSGGFDEGFMFSAPEEENAGEQEEKTPIEGQTPPEEQDSTANSGEGQDSTVDPDEGQTPPAEQAPENSESNGADSVIGSAVIDGDSAYFPMIGNPTPGEDGIEGPEPNTEGEAEIKETYKINIITAPKELGAYVQKLSLEGIVDGTLPFDEKKNVDAAGDDSAANNKRVRTFDTVTYNLETSLGVSDSSVAGLQEIKLFFEMTLDKDITEARIDVAGMQWMDDDWRISYENARGDEVLYETAGGLFPHGKTQPTNINAYLDSHGTAFLNEAAQTSPYRSDIVRQVLTGSYTKTVDSGALGTQSLSASVQVLASKNEDKLEPSFKAWLDGNQENTGASAGVNVVKANEDNTVTITAAPRYNIRVEKTPRLNYVSHFDLGTGNKTDAENDTEGTVIYGSMRGYGINLELYNNVKDKGLKGIELPIGPIEFDLVLTESISENDSQQREEPNYVPVLWDYNENINQDTKFLVDNPVGKWGRNLYWNGISYTRSGYWAGPWNTGNSSVAAYNGGSWSIDKDTYKKGKAPTGTDVKDRTYHVVVNNYDFDFDNYAFPSQDAGDGSGYGNTSKNPFSVGYIETLVQYPEGVEGTTTTGFLVEAKNLTAQSLSESKASGKEETKKDDNIAAKTFTLYPDGSFTKYNSFTSTGSGHYASGFLGTSYWGGADDDAAAFAGDSIKMWGAITWGPENVLHLHAANILQKFDSSMLEINGGPTYVQNAFKTGMDDKGSATFLYAADPQYPEGYQLNKIDEEDGTVTQDMDVAYRMDNAKEEDYIYFKSRDDLKNAGYTCVGVLMEVRGADIYPNRDIELCVPMKVKDDESRLLNQTASTVNVVRVWTGDNAMEGVSWANGSTSLGKNEQNSVEGYEGVLVDGKTAYIEQNNEKICAKLGKDYVKSEHKDGKIISHTGGHQAGMSLLVVSYKTKVALDVENTSNHVGSNSTNTVNFDMGKAQYDAKYTLSNICADVTNATAPPKLGEKKTTLTITVDLPAQMDAPDNFLMDGNAISTDPENPTEVKFTANNTSYPILVSAEYDAENHKLVFVIKDAPVGVTVPEITFNETIDPAKVKHNDQLEVVAGIQGSGDQRAYEDALGNRAHQTINITKLTSTGLIKRVYPELIERNGEINYTLEYSNSSENAVQGLWMYDILPYDEDGRQLEDKDGSNFHGTIKAQSVSVKQLPTGSEVTVYATNTPAGEINSNIRNFKGANSDGVIDEMTLINTYGFTKLGVINSENKTVNVPEDTTCLYFYVTQVAANSALKIDIQTTTDGNQAKDIYCNNSRSLEQKNTDHALTSNTVKTEVVARSISGLAWLDSNRNGKQDEDEEKLSGVTVSLVDANDETVGTTTTGNWLDVSNGTKTGLVNDDSLGRVYNLEGLDSASYAFVNVPEGNYKVVFGDEAGEELKIYAATEADAEGVDKDVNSDAQPIYAEADGVTLKQTEISSIEMRSLEKLTGVYVDDSLHNDSGFYLGELTISKEVVDDKEFPSGAKNGAYTFEIIETQEAINNRKFTTVTKDADGTQETGEITFTSNSKYSSITLMDGQTITIQNLPMGLDMKVIETDAPVNNYKWTIKYEGAGTTNPKKDHTRQGISVNSSNPVPEVKAINTYIRDKGSLTINKTVVVPEEGTFPVKEKTLTFDIEAVEKPVSVEDYNSGKAKRVSLNGNFELVDSSGNPVGSVRFTNGWAEIEFTVKAEDSWKNSVTIKNLPTGYYIVKELKADVQDYVVGITNQFTCNKVETGGNTKVNVTNTYTLDDGKTTLKLTKTVLADWGIPVSREFTFQITGNMADGEAIEPIEVKVNSNSVSTVPLIAGTYTITEVGETDIEYYTWKGVHFNGSPNDLTFTLKAPAHNEAEHVITVNAVNSYTRKLGNLSVTKTVNGNTGETDREFNFTVTLKGNEGEIVNGAYGEMEFTDNVATFTLKHGETKTATGLPAGVTYTVVETEANQSGYSTASTGAEGTIPVSDTAIAEFVNSRSSYTSYTSLSVVKVWNDEGHEENRPASIQVQLYRSGSPYGNAVTLSEGNGWSYEWNRLDDSYNWTIGEVDVPDGYTSQVTGSGTSYTITNTYDTTIPDDDIPDDDIPLDDIPDDDIPLTDLPDDDIPLADLPDEDIPLTELPDDEIPLDEAPQTGDNSRKGLWLALAICSAFGMAITGKLLKTKEEDQGDGEN